MANLNGENYSIEKIEIDEKAEPYLVEVPASSLVLDDPDKDGSVLLPENKESIGKQLVMNKVFGSTDPLYVNNRQKKLRHILAILFAVIVVGVICWTAYNDFFSEQKTLPPAEFISNLLGSNWFFLLLALTCLALCYLFKGLRLSLLNKSLTGKARFRICLNCATFGLYYNYVTPLAVGGPPYEIYYLSKNGVESGYSSSIPLSSYILHQCAFVLLSALSLIFFSINLFNIPNAVSGVFPTVITVLCVIGLILSLFMPLLVIVFSLSTKTGSKLVKFGLKVANKLKLVKNVSETENKVIATLLRNSASLKEIAKNPLLFVSSFTLAILEHLSLMSIAYFTLKTFGLNWGGGISEWLQTVTLCFLLQSGVSFIPTPGNSGAADLSFYLLFETGLNASTGISYGGLAFPAMICWRFLSFYFFVIFGFICSNARKRRLKKTQNPPENP